MANATRIADVARGPYVGKYTGTTAAQNIHIGFKPSYIKALDRTAGTGGWEWFKDDTANVLTSIVGGHGTAAIAVTQIDNGTVLGFSLPSNATVNANGDVYVFLAIPE